MPRIRRLDYCGAHHHVMNRGARQQHVFAVDGARQLFLELLAELPERFGVEIFAYAIMGNHYHLTLRSPAGGLPPVMQRLDQVFTQRLNHRMGWDGPVFRGRYHDVLVGDAAHWEHLLAYLHGNPGRAGLPDKLHDPLWTSHAAYLSGGESAPWLTVEPALARHGGVRGYCAWLREVSTGEVEPPEAFDPIRYGGPGSDLRPARVRVGSVEELCDQLRFVLGGQLPRGRFSGPECWLCAWWLRSNGTRIREVAELLAVGQSTVSRWTDRYLEHRREDPLATWSAVLIAPDRSMRLAG